MQLVGFKCLAKCTDETLKRGHIGHGMALLVRQASEGTSCTAARLLQELSSIGRFVG